MQLFILVNSELQLNVPEIVLIKEFNNILVHSERCESDPSGSKKHFAYMKFNYIYQICDYKSYVNQHGLSEKEAHEFAINVSGLPKDWKVDDLTKVGMERYKQLRPSPARELNKEILATLHTSGKLVAKINRYLEKQLEKPDFKDDDINNITTNHFKAIELAKKIPEQIKALNDLKDTIDKEEGNVDKRRGGDEIRESMEANNNIESIGNIKDDEED